MKLYTQNKNYKLYNGNMLDMLEDIKENSIDSIITDPPYELNFMNKGWDNSGIAFQKETWEKCFKVLKSGGYLLAFGGSRTFHRIACAIEDAGFEIRDTIMWLYGSGFPKSMSLGKVIEGKLTIGSANVKDIKKLDGEKISVTCGFNKTGKETGYRDKEYEMFKTDVNYHTELGKKYSGWGTALKPSFEPIIVARKPFKGTLVDNVIKYGVGGINIDECRVPHNEECKVMKKQNKINSIIQQSGRFENTLELKPNGRFPANTILTYDETDFDEVCGGFPNTKVGGGIKAPKTNINLNNATNFQHSKKYEDINYKSDSGSASRYFYCAKASKKDRDEGCQDLEDTFNACSNQAIAEQKRGNNNFTDEKNSTFNKVYVGKNTHPTVKPTELMQYLVRLVSPNNAIILDPFNGSGSTGKAVMFENKERNKNYKYIGIELTEEYLPIAKARIDYVCNLNINNEEKNENIEQYSFDDLI